MNSGTVFVFIINVGNDGTRSFGTWNKSGPEEKKVNK
jgi:hypothetical protein